MITNSKEIKVTCERCEKSRLSVQTYPKRPCVRCKGKVIPIPSEHQEEIERLLKVKKPDRRWQQVKEMWGVSEERPEWKEWESAQAELKTLETKIINKG